MATLVVNYGKDIVSTTIQALEASSLESLLHKDTKVALKPNLVLDSKAELGATTHPAVVEGVIVFLRRQGIKDIRIIESSWVGCKTERAVKACGYDTLCKQYDVPFIDLKQDKTVKAEAGGYAIHLCKEAVETDFLINIPVLKAHCQTGLTCCLKNLKGCIPDSDKRNFHSWGLHKPIAALNQALKTHFCVVDGICGDLTFEEGGNPVERDMILVGEDPVLVDSYCAELIGLKREEVPYIGIAAAAGVGTLFHDGMDIIVLNQDKKPAHQKTASRLAQKLAAKVDEKDACSACYSALIFGLHQSQYQGKDKIKIGQGYRGKTIDGPGVGNCTKGAGRSVSGCPPKASDITQFLQKL